MDEKEQEYIVNRVIQIAELFSLIRSQYKGKTTKDRNEILRQYLPRKEPWKGKYFKTFLKFHMMLNGNTDIDIEKYIKAIFELTHGREVYPSDLVSEYSARKYCKYMKYEKNCSDKMPTKVCEKDIIENERKYFDQYRSNNSVSDIWEVEEEFDGAKIPMPISYMIKGMITHHYIMDIDDNKTMFWSMIAKAKGWIDTRRYNAIYVDYLKRKNRIFEL